MELTKIHAAFIFWGMSWKDLSLIFLGFSFLFLGLPTLFFQLDSGCLPAFDLGLFSQHILGAWRGEMDPFIPIRGLHLSQDHWDPITIVVGWLLRPFGFLWSVPRMLMVFESGVIVASAAMLHRSLLDRGFEGERAAVAAATFLFSTATWNAVLFPVHPTTWTLAPLTFLVIATFDFFSGRASSRTWWGVFVAALLLFLSGEQFSFAVFGYALGLCLFCPRERRLSAFLFLLSLLMLWWAFHGRLFLHGSVYDYDGRLSLSLSTLIQQYKFDADFWKRLLGGVAGFAGAFWSLFSWARSRPAGLGPEARMILVGLFMLGPLLLGRFLAASWRFHYGVAILPLMAFVFFLGPKTLFSGRRHLVFIFVGLTCVSSLGDWSQALRILVGEAPSCAASTVSVGRPELDQRRKELDEMLSLIKPGDHVLTGFYLAANVIERFGDQVEVYVFSPFELSKTDLHFHHVWTSRGSFGDNWPYDQRDLQPLRDRLKDQGSLNQGFSTEMWTGAFEGKLFSGFGEPQKMKLLRGQ